MSCHEKYMMLVSKGENHSYCYRGCWICGKASQELVEDLGQADRSLSCGDPSNIALYPMNFNLSLNQPQLLAANLRPLSAGP